MKKLIARIAEFTGWCTLGVFALLALLMLVPGGFLFLGVLLASERLEEWANDGAE